MTKKKVTAPLTYNPGKGRPKEHLAYLNYQEMQALKRLNGNNQERGPRGLPSFPPADSRSGSYNSGYGSGGSKPSGGSKGPGGGMMGGSGSGGPSRTSPSSGGRDGGIRDSVGANRPSSSGVSRGDVGGRDSGTRGGVGSNRPSSSGASRGDVAGRDGGTRNIAGANTPDKSSINSVNRTNTLGAQKSPAFKADTGRTVNVGPMGTPVNVKAPPGGKIKGAIQGVKTPKVTQTVTRGVSVPAATMTTQQMVNLYSQYQQPPSPPPTEKQIAQKLREAYPDRWGKYSVDEVAETVKTLAGALPGEADINRYSAGSMRNLAQVGINQVNRNITPKGMLKAIDTTGLDIKRGTQSLAMPGPSSMGMTTNWADPKLARQSYETALRSIESAAENKGVAPQARNATNFVAAGTPMVRGVKSVGAPVDGTQFGVDPAGRSAVAKRNQIADMKRDYSQYRTPGADVRIVPASASLEEEGIQKPRPRPPSQNMQRPPSQNMQRPPTAGLSYTYDLSLPPGYYPSGYMNDPFSNLPRYTEEQRKLMDERMEGLFEGYEGNTVAPGVKYQGDYPLTSMGTAPVVEMPQISLSPEQREIIEERVDTGQIALKGTGAGLSLISGVPGGRKLGGYLGEKYEESVKKKLDNYVLATPEQRAEMERKDPSLTAWAGIIGETPQLDRSNYTNWADRSGLRGPPDRRGGRDNSGIASLDPRPTGDSTTTPRPDTPSTTPGRRPDIYYMWDLGVNIPSPSDPNYNQYQTYLAERLAAQRAMGYV
jgi:hypothetical protein